MGVDISLLGKVHNKSMVIDGELLLSVKDAEQLHTTGLDILFAND